MIEARGEPDAGTIGDIFAMRAIRLGAAGVITDGACATRPAIRRLDIPVYHGSSHAATFRRAAHAARPPDPDRLCRRHGDARRRHRRRRGRRGGDPRRARRGGGRRRVPAGTRGGMGVRTSWPPARAPIGAFPISPTSGAPSSRRGWRVARRRQGVTWHAVRSSRVVPAQQPDPGVIAHRPVRRCRASSSVAIRARTSIPDDVEAQLANLFHHVGEMLAGAGADWRHVAKMTFYVPDLSYRERDQHAVGRSTSPIPIRARLATPSWRPGRRSCSATSSRTSTIDEPPNRSPHHSAVNVTSPR